MGHTNNLIKDLVGPASVTPATKFVLVSAIHFKGLWEHPFKTPATKNEDFIQLDGRKKQVKMMNQTGSFQTGSSGDFAGLVLPYKGGKTSMVLLLPKENSSKLHELASNGALLENAAQESLKWRSAKTQVKLPKFKIETELDACDPVKALGATEIFSASTLDLSGMLADAKGHGIEVGAIIHKAFVQVDEEGTEAAAATAIVGRGGGPPAPPPQFFCDRPFVFMICSGSTILFVGKHMTPSS